MKPDTRVGADFSNGISLEGSSHSRAGRKDLQSGKRGGCLCAVGNVQESGRATVAADTSFLHSMRSAGTLSKCPNVPNVLPRAALGNYVLVLSAWLRYSLRNTLSQIVEVFNFHLHLKISDGDLGHM